MELNLNVKNKLILMTAGIFVVTVFIGYSFIYKAGVKKAVQLRERMEEVKNMNALLEEVRVLNNKINGYLTMKINSPDPSNFLSKVTDIANECGIKIDSLNIEKPTKDGEYTFLSCSLGFAAPYHQLRVFMAKLESDKKFIRVDSLSVSPVGKETKKDQAKESGILVNVKMELTGFYCS